MAVLLSGFSSDSRVSEDVYLSFCIFNVPIRQGIIVLKVTAGTLQPINRAASVYVTCACIRANHAADIH